MKMVNSRETTQEASPEQSRARSVIGKIGVVALAALAVTVPPYVTHKAVRYYVESRWTDEQFLYHHLSESVLQKRAGVSCPDTIAGNKNILGMALRNDGPSQVPGILIRKYLCQSVRDYAHSEDKSKLSQNELVGVYVAVHEAEHVNNGNHHGTEAETHCVAFQKIPLFAKQLGASENEISDMMDEQRKLYFNFYNPDYRTLQCRDGGTYDLDPAHPGMFPYTPSGQPALP
ncbi:MAG TPA: hypothetical protein VK983_03775 [Candidatus Limnocylindrales bacterium]|nr:hypothetical protein [Candidatus Limnocylindrales bacterium]